MVKGFSSSVVVGAILGGFGCSAVSVLAIEKEINMSKQCSALNCVINDAYASLLNELVQQGVEKEKVNLFLSQFRNGQLFSMYSSLDIKVVGMILNKLEKEDVVQFGSLLYGKASYNNKELWKEKESKYFLPFDLSTESIGKRFVVFGKLFKALDKASVEKILKDLGKSKKIVSFFEELVKLNEEDQVAFIDLLKWEYLQNPESANVGKILSCMLANNKLKNKTFFRFLADYDKEDKEYNYIDLIFKFALYNKEDKMKDLLGKLSSLSEKDQEIIVKTWQKGPVRVYGNDGYYKFFNDVTDKRLCLFLGRADEDAYICFGRLWLLLDRTNNGKKKFFGVLGQLNEDGLNFLVKIFSKIGAAGGEDEYPHELSEIFNYRSEPYRYHNIIHLGYGEEELVDVLKELGKDKKNMESNLKMFVEKLNSGELRDLLAEIKKQRSSENFSLQDFVKRNLVGITNVVEDGQIVEDNKSENEQTIKNKQNLNILLSIIKAIFDFLNGGAELV